MRRHDFRTFFESFLGPSWAPKGESNGAQVGPKTDQNRRRKRRCKKKWFKLVLGRSWSRLGPIFGLPWPNLKPSWGDLGAAGGREFVVFPYVFSILFETYVLRIKMVILAGLGAILSPLGAILGASWADLGPTWAPKRAQKGAQDDPKTTSFFSLIFDPILVRFRGAQGPRMAPQGGGFPRF